MILDRITHVYISDYPMVFPRNDLYPEDDLYPVGAEQLTSLDTIVEGSMSLEEVLFDNELVFGQLCATRFEVKIYNSPNLSGKYIHVTQENSGLPSFVFSGKIDSCKLDNSRADRKIVAYDYGYTYANINVANWWESTWEGKTTRTLKELRTSLLNYLGIRYDATQTFINDSFAFTKSAVLQKVTFADMIKSICELSVVFPHFSRRGNYIEFIQLNPNATPINLNTKYEGQNSLFEEYTTASIVGVTFYDSENNIKQTIGQGGNTYSVTDTILTLDLTSAQLTTIGTNMLNAISELTYSVGDLKLILGKMDYKLGDLIETSIGTFFVTRNSYSGLQLVEETLSSTGSEFVQTPKSSFQNIITGERWARFKQDVDEFRLEYGQTIQEIDGELTTQSSLISQNSTAIQTEVTRATGAENALSSSITQTAESITAEVTRATSAENSLSTRITQTSDAITSEVTRATTKEGQLQSSITQNATAITTKVSKDGVISSINQSAEAVTIDANKININGTVSANGYFQVDSNGKVSISGSNGILSIDDGVLSQWARDSQGYLNYIGFANDSAELRGSCNYPSYTQRMGLTTKMLSYAIDTGSYSMEYGHYGWNEFFLAQRKIGAYSSYPAVSKYDTLYMYSETGYKQAANSDYSLIPQGDGNVVMYYHFGANDQSVTWASGTSSKWMKENIADMTDEEAKKILDVHVVDFDFKEGFMNGQKGCHGVIAEEIADIIPYATHYPPNYEEPESEEDVKPGETPLPHVGYDRLVPHLIKMVQIQQKEIDELKRMVSSLEEGD